MEEGAVAMAEHEVATASGDPGGPRGPSELWLLTQRLDDIRRAQDSLKADLKERLDTFQRSQDDLRADVKALDAKIDGVEKRLDAKIDGVAEKLDAKIDALNGRLYLLLVPVTVAILGLLVKLLIPAA